MKQSKDFVLENSPVSVPDYIAYCGLAAALRPFVRRKTRAFLAALVLPDVGMLSSYSRAADELLGRTVGRYGTDEQIEVLFVDSKVNGGADTVRRLKSARRAIMFIADADDVTPEIRLAADIVAPLPAPTANHVQRAAWKLKTPISDADADLIVAEPWARIRLAFRRYRTVGQSIASLRANLPVVTPEPEIISAPGPRLEDLGGYGEAKEWGLELARDLADWKAGRIQWDDVDRGILLSGAPGSGKTTFAAALARTCGVELVVGSAASWQAKGHMGDMLKAMRAAFDMARVLAPSILFIDEIDAFGDRERASEQHADYVRQVIAGLLECLDGAEERSGVVIVGACNFPQFLDPAVTRPGRLDRHIRIPAPDETARRAIFRWHLKDDLKDFDLGMVAAASDGLTGAEIEQIVRGARRTARRQKREMIRADLTNLLPPPLLLPEATRKAVAVHEAGHAVIGVLVSADEVHSVSINVASSQALSVRMLGSVEMRPTINVVRTRSYYLDRLAVLLAGIAAEDVCLGDRSDGAGGTDGSDLVSATDIATCMEGPWGMGRSFVSEPGTEPHRLMLMRLHNPDLARRVDQLLADQFQRARSLLIENREAVEAVASRLLSTGKLTGDEVFAIINGARMQQDDDSGVVPMASAGR
ncbi:AAA family ATPase [Rhizobium sp. 9T]|uniref:AAA family ATPase n=1 Tax=Rhizobium croatiense TaxID=2867516 RepID=UPI001C931CA1|nr:AAA family ATPase [Rhizobium croatiense]MBY4607478.1 AAA family ATPase [Rhizobium croatiense]